MHHARPRIAVRAYESADAAATLQVFLDAITFTAAADYSPAQVAAWARVASRDVTEWDRSMRRRSSIVAVIDDTVVGFSDVDAHGFIEMLYVAPDRVRRGVARALMAEVEALARQHGATHLAASVSITARPFFAASGFQVQQVQHPVVAGVAMVNFAMVRPLSEADPPAS